MLLVGALLCPRGGLAPGRLRPGAYHPGRVRGAALYQPHGAQHARRREPRPLCRIPGPHLRRATHVPLRAGGGERQGRRRPAWGRGLARAGVPRLPPGRLAHAPNGTRAATGGDHQRDPRATHVQRRRSPGVRHRRDSDDVARDRGRCRRHDPRRQRVGVSRVPRERPARRRILRLSGNPGRAPGRSRGELRQPVLHRAPRVGTAGLEDRRVVLVWRHGERRQRPWHGLVCGSDHPRVGGPAL